MLDVERFTARLSSAIRPGKVRISATEPVISEILAPHLSAARHSIPGFRLELLVQSDVMSLALDDADLAIRLIRPSGNSLMAIRLPKLEMGLFAARTYAPVSAGFAELARQRWLGYDDPHGEIAEVRWIREHGLSDAQTMRTSSTRALVNACAAGAGIAILPKVMTFRHPELVQLPIADAVPPRTHWLVWRSGELEGKRLRPARSWVLEAFKTALAPHSAPSPGGRACGSFLKLHRSL
ncbi:MAG: substrate-binding domain-containing protein [Hyphomicrobiales bacterium]|nr:substrate-binding domain-containing protein [Hyphomicrobiales bacterium]